MVLESVALHSAPTYFCKQSVPLVVVAHLSNAIESSKEKEISSKPLCYYVKSRRVLLLLCYYVTTVACPLLAPAGPWDERTGWLVSEFPLTTISIAAVVVVIIFFRRISHRLVLLSAPRISFLSRVARNYYYVVSSSSSSSYRLTCLT